ncbi:hypothetical protein ERJ75_001123200 [Trypanosoma vivax]|nr:hypothetical protein ERJ75_001123200 [Trypanosoma vivax]
MCFPPSVAESSEQAHPARSGQSTERCGDEKEDAAALGPTERVLQGQRMALWMRPREEQYLHGGACTELKNTRPNNRTARRARERGRRAVRRGKASERQTQCVGFEQKRSDTEQEPGEARRRGARFNVVTKTRTVRVCGARRRSA